MSDDLQKILKAAAPITLAGVPGGFMPWLAADLARAAKGRAVFIAPDDSPAEHDRLLAVEEKLVGELDLPYRVVNVAAGDLGASAAKKYDIEAWFPGEQAYREITSCSNTTDYQARRLKIRIRTEQGNEVLHTLNGTACAVGRTILAILENHQQPDGSVVIPEALRRYTGFDVIES